MTDARAKVQTVAELRARLAAEDAGKPFLLYRDEGGVQQIVQLPEEDRLTIGRGGIGIRLPWDEEVSRTHAVLERIGDEWTIDDDGLSRNGTRVNDARIDGRRRLRDGDVIRCGRVALQYRDPAASSETETAVANAGEADNHGITPGQRRVLVELCRPLAESPFRPPATNKEIAERLVVSVDAVKSQLQRLAVTFEATGLMQNRQRAEIAEKALLSGAVTERDFRSGGA
jgi:hypothetical protein